MYWTSRRLQNRSIDREALDYKTEFEEQRKRNRCFLLAPGRELDALGDNLVQVIRQVLFHHPLELITDEHLPLFVVLVAT